MLTCQYCVVVVKVVLAVLCSSYLRTAFMHAVMNEYRLAVAKMLTAAADASIWLSPLAAGTLLTRSDVIVVPTAELNGTQQQVPPFVHFMERVSFISLMTDSWEGWGRRDLMI